MRASGFRALRCAAVAAAVACAFGAGSTRAGTNLFVGFAENDVLWDAASVVPPARDLDAASFRLSVNWAPGQTALAPGDAAALDGAFAATTGLRIVLVVVGGAATYAPQDDASRDTFCTYARNILARYPTLLDVLIWNEPNKTAFWRPQFNPDDTSAAPAAYEALLARCYDVLHAFRPSVNVLGPALSPDGNDNPHAVSNISHSPGNFIRRLGDAYKASLRLPPILDTVAHHVYGADSAERPWRQHTGQTRIAEGDWDKLMTNLHTAFDGTGQRVPGLCASYRCVSIWYMEDGFQTSIDPPKAGLYSNAENVTVIPDDAGGEPNSPPPPATSPAPDQATQIVDSIRLAYCQNYVGGFFNFELRDDADLRGWQSGALWIDNSPKDSYDDFGRAIGEANARTVDCATLKGGLPPRPDTTAPATPTGLTASAPPGQRRVVLDWADNPESDIPGYDIYRSTTQGGPYTKLDRDPVPASSYLDTDVDFGQTYYYRVVARDTADNSSPESAEVSARPVGPTAVTLRSFTAQRAPGQVILRWRTGDESGTLGYNLYRGDPTRTRLNRTMILASGRATGRSYSARYATGRGGTFWLQAVRIDGGRRLYGPARMLH